MAHIFHNTFIPQHLTYTLRSHIPVTSIKPIHHPQYIGHPGINGDGAATAITIPTLRYLQIISRPMQLPVKWYWLLIHCCEVPCKWNWMHFLPWAKVSSFSPCM